MPLRLRLRMGLTRYLEHLTVGLVLAGVLIGLGARLLGLNTEATVTLVLLSTMMPSGVLLGWISLGSRRLFRYSLLISIGLGLLDYSQHGQLNQAGWLPLIGLWLAAIIGIVRLGRL